MSRVAEGPVENNSMVEQTPDFSTSTSVLQNEGNTTVPSPVFDNIEITPPQPTSASSPPAVNIIKTAFPKPAPPSPRIDKTQPTKIVHQRLTTKLSRLDNNAGEIDSVFNEVMSSYPSSHDVHATLGKKCLKALGSEKQTPHVNQRLHEGSVKSLLRAKLHSKHGVNLTGKDVSPVKPTESVNCAIKEKEDEGSCQDDELTVIIVPQGVK